LPATPPRADRERVLGARHPDTVASRNNASASDTATLNRFFREYYLEHGQGGTHTLQRNLIQLFGFLERE